MRLPQCSLLLFHIVSIASAAGLPTPAFEPRTVGTIEKGYGLSVADVDGDGKLDILLADVWDFYWFRHGDWKRFHLAGRLDNQGTMAIDARDVDGDGKVEIAVCTRGPLSAVYFLKRPADPTQPWTPVKIPSEPEQHRIKWARDVNGTHVLVSVPNLGRQNHLRIKNLPVDEKVKIYAYEFTLDPEKSLRRRLLVDSMRDMHSFTVAPDAPGGAERIFFAGIEGIELMGNSSRHGWKPAGVKPLPGMTEPVRRVDGSLHAGIGEIDEGRTATTTFIGTVEPKHGTMVAAYTRDAQGGFGRRQLLDDTLITAHALDCVDVLGLGRDQIVVGWWGEEAKKNYGIRIYAPVDDAATRWQRFSVDEGTMACQSMQVIDMDGDGRLDIVAAGWSSKNLMIFYNRTPGAKTSGEPRR